MAFNIPGLLSGNFGSAYEDAYGRIVGGSPQSMAGLLADPAAAENFRQAPLTNEPARTVPTQKRSLLSSLANFGGKIVKGSTGADQFSNPDEARAALKAGLMAYGQGRMALNVDGGEALNNMLLAGTKAGQSMQDRNRAAADALRLQAARAKYLDPSLPMAQRVETALQRAFDANDEEGVTHFTNLLRSMGGSVAGATKAQRGELKEGLGPDGKPGYFRVDPETDTATLVQGMVPIPQQRDMASATEASEQRKFQREQMLSTRYFADTKAHREFSDLYGTLQSNIGAAQGGDPAAQMATIFSFMKLLDPGSVVREGEYATAANASGVDESVRNAYNAAIKGAKIPPEAIARFGEAAARLMARRKPQLERDMARYRKRATDAGIDPENVVVDWFNYGGATPPSGQKSVDDLVNEATGGQ